MEIPRFHVPNYQFDCPTNASEFPSNFRAIPPHFQLEMPPSMPPFPMTPIGPYPPSLSHRILMNDINFKNRFSPRAFSPRNPELYKTTLCNFWLSGKPCRFGNECWFAHGQHELRVADFVTTTHTPPDEMFRFCGTQPMPPYDSPPVYDLLLTDGADRWPTEPLPGTRRRSTNVSQMRCETPTAPPRFGWSGPWARCACAKTDGAEGIGRSLLGVPPQKFSYSLNLLGSNRSVAESEVSSQVCDFSSTLGWSPWTETSMSNDWRSPLSTGSPPTDCGNRIEGATKDEEECSDTVLAKTVFCPSFVVTPSCGDEKVTGSSTNDSSQKAKDTVCDMYRECGFCPMGDECLYLHTLFAAGVLTDN